MKHETILVPIKCSERLPEMVMVNYWTDLGELFWNGKFWTKFLYSMVYEPTVWYEEQHDKIVLSEEEFKMIRKGINLLMDAEKPENFDKGFDILKEIYNTNIR